MKTNIIQKADDLFFNGDYKSALYFYSDILKNNPKDQDAQIGIILTDIAINDSPIKAHTLFD
jgi:hypothetical protein